jgi:predicted DNA-binding transcriptional regulator AlpA
MKYVNMRQLRQKLAGRSRSAIYTDIAFGRLPPPIKMGGKLLWDESAVDARLRELAAEAQAKKKA